MIRELRVSGFKAFANFRVNFGYDSVLVGPNNAGKSTLIAALRAASVMLRLAKQRVPDQGREDQDRSFLAYGLSGERVGLVEENLRHEFRNAEARIHVKFRTKASLTAVWPEESRREDSDEEGSSPFFYLEIPDRPQPRRPLEVRKAFPAIGVIPALVPVERSEVILNEDYVRQHAESRLASRHFRNHLVLLHNQDRLREFFDWAEPWIADVELQGIERRTVPGEGLQIDFFLREAGSRTQREICWAGDGLQVWLQLLLHLFRLTERTIIVLDVSTVTRFSG